jgi:hypothetical protein
MSIDSVTAESVTGSFEPDYNPISPELEVRLIEELIGSSELATGISEFALLTLDGNSRFSNLARALECQRFQEYFDNGPQEMKEEYGPYEDSSTFFLMVNRADKRVAGVMRIIENGEAGHKSVNDMPTEKTDNATDLSIGEVYGVMGIDPSKTLDVATIASASEYSKKNTGGDITVRAALMRAVYHYGLGNDFTDLVAIIDSEHPEKSPLKVLMSVNLPIHTTPYIKSHFPYMGAGENDFIHIPLEDVESSVSAKERSLFDYVFGSVALGGACELSFSRQ